MTEIDLRFAHADPAGGAPFADLMWAALVGSVLIGALVWLGFAHRSGRTRLVSGLASFSERVSGLPAWAALPAGIAGGSLIVAAFGFYWDVSTHIDSGRDAGVFANASHFWIVAGLGGIALAGYVSLLLGTRPGPNSVRLREGWHLPIGGILLFVCGSIALLGFPLDDVWHRLFGQDVTLWSPTHLQMVGGASLSTLALWVLLVEGGRDPVDPQRASRMLRRGEIATAGAFLIGLSAFQAEFDYSVPQFRLLFHPVLLMLSSSIALVAARIRLGPGGAVKALAFFLVLRATFSLIISGVLGHTTLHFPLYVVEALMVEAVGLSFGTSRHFSFGALAGAAIGTVGLAAEWAWSHAWMTMEWPASLLPEALVLGFLAGVSGGALGGLIGLALSPAAEHRQRVPRSLGLATAVGVLLALFYPLPSDADLDGTAHFSLEEVGNTEERWVRMSFALEPRGLAQDAEWFNVTAWQGGGSVVAEPEPREPGRYAITEPLPVHGDWKALLRLQRGSSIMAVPIYLPHDEAIPAPEVPAEDSFSRDLISDKEIVLREAKDVGATTIYGATAAIGAIAIAWVVVLSWGLRRLARSGDAARAGASLG